MPMKMCENYRMETIREKSWEERWEEAAAGSTFSKIYPRAEFCWDSSAKFYDKGMGGSLERVDSVFRWLKEHGFSENSLKTALDIGSGTGTYTLPLAKYVSRVTALDCSSEMNRILREKLLYRQQKNVSVITADFEQYDFRGETFDLVIGSMNPELYRPETFKKMLWLAKKVIIYVGIISGLAGQTEKKMKSSVEEIVCGKAPSHNGSNLVMYPYHVLEEMGYAPEILEEECTWEYEEEASDVVKSLLFSLQNAEGKCMDWQKKIRDYVYENAVGDKIINQGKCKLGILFCKL